MISLQIQDVKDFMNHLLLKSTFDPFLVVEGTVTTYNTFHMNGRLKPEYYSSEEQEALGLSERSSVSPPLSAIAVPSSSPRKTQGSCWHSPGVHFPWMISADLF